MLKKNSYFLTRRHLSRQNRCQGSSMVLIPSSVDDLRLETSETFILLCVCRICVTQRVWDEELEDVSLKRKKRVVQKGQNGQEKPTEEKGKEE